MKKLEFEILKSLSKEKLDPDDWNVDKMLEVDILNEENFHKIRETLTRIGIVDREEPNVLYQNCHILHKNGRYYIASFKELFALDKKCHSLSMEDIARRNTVARLLRDWGLLNILQSDEPFLSVPQSRLKIVKYSERKNWFFDVKYVMFAERNFE